MPHLPRLAAALFLLAVVVSTSTGFAAEYYVAPTGLDSNPGTLAAPWLTVQKAANTLKPGDTAFVRAGTYARVTVNVSGSAAGGPVRFINYLGETPVIDATGVTPPPDDDTALFLVSDHSYVTIQGFELRNYQTTDISLTPAGILVIGACQHVLISQCNIHDIANTGGNPDNAGNAFGIAVYGTSTTPDTDIVIDRCNVHNLRTGSSESVALNGNVTNFQVTNNLVHDNNNIGIVFIGFEGTCPDAAQDQARDGVCRGNTVWNISSEGNQAYAPGDDSADGLYCDGAARVVLERNIVHNTDIGCELTSEHSGHVASADIFRDNIVYANRQTGLALGGYANRGTGGSDGCAILNNTFFGNDTLGKGNGELLLRFRTANCTVRDNIFFSGPGNQLVIVPVSAANNINNRLDYNLYFAPGGAAKAQWSWNNTPQTGLAAWQKASEQDSRALFADPLFANVGQTPDLHLRAGSTAIDAGDPAFAIGTGETDVDGGARVIGARVDIGADESAAGTGTPSTLPAIELSVIERQVPVGTGAVGAFTISIAAPLATNLFVNYSVKGSAMAGTDYAPLRGTARIKAGKTTKKIKIVPEGDLGGASKKGIKLTLEPGEGYTLGTAVSARLRLVQPVE